MEKGRRLSLSVFLAFAVAAHITACSDGGGGGESSAGTSTSTYISDWEPGVYLPSEYFADQCTSVLPQNNWLRSWSHETYLWYDEIEDRNPADYDDPTEYFELLKTEGLTLSGKKKDNFHFWMPTDEWNRQSQSGVAVGYGFQWALISTSPPRKAVVAYSDRDGEWPSGVRRGLEVVSADGVDLAYGNDVDTLNAALFPSQVGEVHSFVLRDPLTFEEHQVELTADIITLDPVQNVQVHEISGGKRVGYMLFNDHIGTAEKALYDAVSQLQDEGIDELVLDLRYNGGGYLAIASQLAYMIAGPERTEDKTFELMQFNDQHPTHNPVTGEPLEPLPFIDIALGQWELPGGQPLPALELERVFVLAGPNTCSASEAIINGLRGVDLEVVLIGGATCGKPYGFYPTDNCDITWFTIQFKGVNDKGFGDYADGFTPNEDYDDGEALVKGCTVADDFTHPLGDKQEGRLAAALNYIASGQCNASAAASLVAQPQIGVMFSDGEGKVVKSTWRQNRIVTLGR